MAQQIPEVPKNACAHSQSTEPCDDFPLPARLRDIKPPDELGIELEGANEPRNFCIRDILSGTDLALYDSLRASQETGLERPSPALPQHNGPSFCEILSFLEVPVFALAKHPACTSRQYTSSNGQFTWTITATSSAGSATIMDGDLLIFVSSSLAAAMKW
jgi:hypothetical protein